MKTFLTLFLLVVLISGISCADDLDGVNAMLDNIQKAHESHDIDLLGAQYSDECMVLIAQISGPAQGAYVLGKEQTLKAMQNQIWQAAGLETRKITDRRIVVKNDLAFIRMTVSDRFKDGKTDASEQFIIAVKRDLKWKVCFGMPAIMKSQAVVTEVTPGSAADKAEIKAGDIIAEYDGEILDPMLSGSDVKSTLKSKGTAQVSLTLLRSGTKVMAQVSPSLLGATVEASLVPAGPARLVPSDEPHPVKDIVKNEIEILKTGDASGYRDIICPAGFFSYRREPGKPVSLISGQNAQATISKQVEESRNILNTSTIETAAVEVLATDNIVLATGIVCAVKKDGSQLETPTRLKVFVRTDDGWRLAADLVERYKLMAGDDVEYRSVEETQKTVKNIQGKITGIGVKLAKDSDGFVIQMVFPGKPADNAKVLVGEIITSIDGRSATNMTVEQGVAAITGQEGTQVTLEIKDASGNVRTVTITRETISVPGVEARMLDDKTGYLGITTFNMETAAAVRNALTKTLSPQKAGGIILDLRDCNGGLYPEVIKVAQMLIPGNPPKVLWTVQQQGKEPQAVKANKAALNSLPCVVLIGEKTAGAAELLAEAMQEHKRATLVGTKSAGMAVLKDVVANPDGSSKVVKIGDFLFPKTGKTGADGVIPDVLAPSDATPNQVLQLGIKTLADILSK